MKIIQTIPVYNRKGQKITSLTAQEAKAIDITKVDEQFFIVEENFVVVKSKFFRHEHLVKSRNFFLHQQDLHFKKKEGVTYKKVLFVFEAPHKNEYDYLQGFKGKTPLFGKLETFRTTFHKLMEELTETQDIAYQVTLYNAVPFLMDLHYLMRRPVKETTKLNFWLYGWHDLKYKKEFINYLEFHKFDYYINASTRAFKASISRVLSTIVPVEHQVHHPNSGFWNRKVIKFGAKKIVHLDKSHQLFQPTNKKEDSIFT